MKTPCCPPADQTRGRSWPAWIGLTWVTQGFERLAAELATPAGWRLLDTQNPVVLMRQRAGLD